MPEAGGDDRRVILFSPRNRDAPAQRTAEAFQGRNISFGWLDEDWASIRLPWIRLAAGVLGKDDSALLKTRPPWGGGLSIYPPGVRPSQTDRFPIQSASGLRSGTGR
jgi:hypothetical protein